MRQPVTGVTATVVVAIRLRLIGDLRTVVALIGESIGVAIDRRLPRFSAPGEYGHTATTRAAFAACTLPSAARKTIRGGGLELDPDRAATLRRESTDTIFDLPCALVRVRIKESVAATRTIGPPIRCPLRGLMAWVVATHTHVSMPFAGISMPIEIGIALVGVRDHRAVVGQVGYAISVGIVVHTDVQFVIACVGVAAAEAVPL